MCEAGHKAARRRNLQRFQRTQQPVQRCSISTARLGAVQKKNHAPQRRYTARRSEKGLCKRLKVCARRRRRAAGARANPRCKSTLRERARGSAVPQQPKVINRNHMVALRVQQGHKSELRATQR